MTAATLLPICFRCRHLEGVAPNKGWTCKAYPDGIPAPILASQHNHRYSYKGDHGVRFEPGKNLASDAQFNEADHPRGGNPENPGQFSAGSGGVSEAEADNERAARIALLEKQVVKTRDKMQALFANALKDKTPEASEKSNAAMAQYEKAQRALNFEKAAYFTGAPSLRAFKNSFSSSSRKAISDYMEDEQDNFSELNASLREGEPLASSDKRIMKGLDAAFTSPYAELANKITLYRGIRLDADELSSLKSGQDFIDPGFVSTSVNESAADRFAQEAPGVGHPVKFVINASKGAPALYLDAFADIYSTEDEVLLPRNAKLKIKSVAQSNGTVIVHADYAAHERVQNMTVANDYITESDGKFTVHAESGKPMGTYRSRAEAEKRLREIDYFKNRGSDARVANDMTKSGWRRIFEGLAEIARFFGEEELEPEHQQGGEDNREPPKGKAASVMFVNDDGCILFVRRSQNEENYPGYWALPGGKVDAGEDHKTAAMRECGEEIGDCTFDGMCTLDARRTPRGWDHVTYAVPAQDHFEPSLNDEHDGYVWAHITAPPQPLHPGVDATLKDVMEREKSRSEANGYEGFDAWNENEHPRAANGQFGSGSGGGGAEAPDLVGYLSQGYGPGNKGPSRFKSEAEKKAYEDEIIARQRKQAKDESEHQLEISKRIRREINRGHSQQQAAAIAYAELGEDAAMAMDWSGAVALPHAKGPGVTLAFDRESSRVKDRDGRLYVKNAHISKANVCEYFGKEIPNWQGLGLDPAKKYALLRDPEELRKAVPTFQNLPILDVHVPATSTSFPQEHIIGSTGTDALFDGTYLDNSLVFWPQSAINDIESNNKKQLSSGYRYVADMTPGTFKGVPYDGVMRDIEGNHIALVREGRAGADVMVTDAVPFTWEKLEQVLLGRGW